jgi:NodT family efflux transporter outer membrane factor (OMF) lipoprotein
MNMQKIRPMLAGVLVSLVLAACAVGPKYARPNDDLTSFHNLARITEKSPAETPPLDRWWIGFNDPMLVKIVSRALSENLDLAASYARVRQARATALGAGAELLPTFDVNGSAAREHQSLRGELGSISGGLPTFRRNVNDFTLGPAASWEVDIFGGLRRNAAASRAELQAAQADHAGVRVTVVAEAADAYFQIRGYQARLGIAQNQIDTDEHLLRLVHARYDAGAGQGREIAQAEALLKQARASLPPLRFGLEQQLNRLDVLMGEQPGTYARELEPTEDIPSIPALPAEAHPSEVLRRRPDIIAAERRLAASNEKIGAAISDYYPKVSLSGALGWDTVSGGHLFIPEAFQSVGTAGLRWRLFDFGKVDAEVIQARGANAEALAVYRLAVLQAAEDVEDALMLLSQTELHVVELRDQVQSLERARDLSEQAYQAGSITLTDVLDADRELLNARDELESNRASSARAAVGVFRAFGGGWDPAGPT